MSCWLATDYYRIEAYASEADRDAACGQTTHSDVKYVPIRESAIPEEERGEIACGSRCISILDSGAVTSMTWCGSDIAGDTIQVAQEKTDQEESDEKLIIPLHRALQRELSLVKRGRVAIFLTTASGQAGLQRPLHSHG